MLAVIGADAEGFVAAVEFATGNPAEAVAGFDSGEEVEGTEAVATVGGLVPNRAEFTGAGCVGEAKVTRGYNENFGMTSLPTGDLATLSTAALAVSSADGLLAATSDVLAAGTGDGSAGFGLAVVTAAGAGATVGGAFGIVAAAARGVSTLGWAANTAAVGDSTAGTGFEPGKKLIWFAAGGVVVGDWNNQAEALGRTMLVAGLAGAAWAATFVAAGEETAGASVPVETATVDADGDTGATDETTRGTTGIGESRLRSGVALRASAVADRGGVDELTDASFAWTLTAAFACVPAGAALVGGEVFFAASCADERGTVGAATGFPKLGNGFHFHQLSFGPGASG